LKFEPAEHQRRDRVAGTAAAVLLATLAIHPREIALGEHSVHVGIARGGISIAPYTVVVFALALCILLGAIHHGRGWSFPPLALLFGALVAVELVFVWPHGAERTAGAIHLLSVVCAWGVGAHLGPRLFRDPKSLRLVAKAIVVIVLVECCVACAQRLGASVNPMDPVTAALMGDRTNGTMNHPAKLGNDMVLLLILSLGMLGTSNRRTRHVLWLAVILLFIPLGLSQSRANIVAAFSTLVLWSILSPNTRDGKLKWVVPLGAVVALLPFVSEVISRWQADPGGGPRGRLHEVALQQISMRPITGTGPNAYISVVSNYDTLAAQGYPVHNVFLLTAAELGIPVAAVFWFPVLVLLCLAWRARRCPGPSGSFAVAILASAPGLYVILTTGWGMLQLSIPVLWFFTLGIAYSQIRLRDERRSQVLSDDASLEHVPKRSSQPSRVPVGV
jgi:hypothetical protein